VATDQITAAGLTKMAYSKTPANCRMYNKPIMNLTDDGVMEDMSAGVNTTQYTPTDRTFGAEISLCPLLKQHTANKVYYVKAMRGGTALYSGPSNWSAYNSDNLLDMFLKTYATPAINDIIAENPGKEIRAVLLRHQGESDNTDLKRNAYYANTVAQMDYIRAFQINGIKYFETAPFLDTYLYYRPEEQQEVDMNIVKETFANDIANSYMIDIRIQPRKMDLTTAQKGGFKPTMSDNEHGSYLAMLQKGESAYDLLRSINWI
jgi:hypothetical protein